MPTAAVEVRAAAMRSPATTAAIRRVARGARRYRRWQQRRRRGGGSHVGVSNNGADAAAPQPDSVAAAAVAPGSSGSTVGWSAAPSRHRRHRRRSRDWQRGRIRVASGPAFAIGEIDAERAAVGDHASTLRCRDRSSHARLRAIVDAARGQRALRLASMRRGCAQLATSSASVCTRGFGRGAAVR